MNNHSDDDWFHNNHDLWIFGFRSLLLSSLSCTPTINTINMHYLVDLIN